MSEYEDDNDFLTGHEQEASLFNVGFDYVVEEGVTLDDLVKASGMALLSIVKLNPFLMGRPRVEVRVGDVLHFPIAFTPPKSKKQEETVFEPLGKLKELQDNKTYLESRQYKQMMLDSELKKKEDQQPRVDRLKYKRMEKERSKVKDKGVGKSQTKIDQIKADYERSLEKFLKSESNPKKRERLERNTSKQLDKWTGKLLDAQANYNALTTEITKHKRELLDKFELSIIEDQLTVLNEGELIESEKGSSMEVSQNMMEKIQTRVFSNDFGKASLKKSDEEEQKLNTDKKKSDKQTEQINSYKELLKTQNIPQDQIDTKVKELENKIKVTEISGKENAKKVIEKMLEPGGFTPDLSVAQLKQIIKLFTSSEMDGEDSRLLVRFIDRFIPHEFVQRAIFGYDDDQIDPGKLDANLRSKFTDKLSKEKSKAFTERFDWVRDRKEYIKDRSYYNNTLSPLLRQIGSEHDKDLGVRRQDPPDYVGTRKEEVDKKPIIEDFSKLPLKERLSYYTTAKEVADKIDLTEGLNQAKLQLFHSSYDNDPFLVHQYFPGIEAKLKDGKNPEAGDFAGLDMFPLLPSIFKDGLGWIKPMKDLDLEAAMQPGFMPPSGFIEKKSHFDPFLIPGDSKMTISQVRALDSLTEPLPGSFYAAQQRVSQSGLSVQTENVNESKLQYLNANPEVAQMVLSVALYQEYGSGTLQASSLQGVDVFPDVEARFKNDGWLMSEETYHEPFRKALFDPFKKPALKSLKDNLLQHTKKGNNLAGSWEYFQRSPMGFANQFPELTSVIFPLGISALALSGVNIAENINGGNYFGDATSLLNTIKPDISVKLFEGTDEYPYGTKKYGPWKGDMKFKFGRTTGILDDGPMKSITYPGSDFLTDRKKYSSKTGLDFNLDINKKNTGDGGVTDFSTRFGPRASVMAYLPNPQNENGILQLVENQITDFNASEIKDFLKTGDTQILDQKFQPNSDYKLDYKVGFQAGIIARGLTVDTNFFYSVLNNFDPQNPVYQQADMGSKVSYNFENLFGPVGGLKLTGEMNKSWKDLSNAYNKQSNVATTTVSTDLDLAKKYTKEFNAWKMMAGLKYVNTTTQTYNSASGTMDDPTATNQLSGTFNFEKDDNKLQSNWRNFMIGLEAGYNFEQSTATFLFNLRARF